MSRPLSENHRAPPTGWKAMPTEFLTPRAYTSRPDPSAFIRTMVAHGSPRSHTLHGPPIGTYSFPSGPNFRYFQLWFVVLGSVGRSATTIGAGGLSSLARMLS